MALKTRMFDPNKPLSEQIDDGSNLDYFELGATLAPYGPKYAEKEDLLAQAKALRGTKAAPGRSFRSSVGTEVLLAPHALENVGNLAQLYAGQQGMKEQYKELGGLGQSIQADLLRTIGGQRDRRKAALEAWYRRQAAKGGDTPTTNSEGVPVDENGVPLMGFGGP